MKIDVEFSLALHNRTGKYFIGRDLLDHSSQLIADVRYWRAVRRQLPGGLVAKLLGRAFSMEVSMRAAFPALDPLLPRLRPPRPVLHLDPCSVLTHVLNKGDIVLCHDLG